MQSRTASWSRRPRRRGGPEARSTRLFNSPCVGVCVFVSACTGLTPFPQKFYFRGVKLIHTRSKITRDIKRRIKDGGAPLERWEHRMLHMQSADMKRCPLPEPVESLPLKPT